MGTKGNQEAGRYLERALRERGYESTTYVNRKETWIPFTFLMFLLIPGAFLFFRVRSVVSLWGALLMLGPLLRAAVAIFKGAPLAVCGVRRATSQEPRKTVVLGAHYDSTSALVSGSVLVQTAKFAAYALLVYFVASAVSVWAALAISALVGLGLMGNSSPGADDNASGVLAVLRSLDSLSDLTDVAIVPVFFNFEEEGLFGSSAFVRGPLSGKPNGIRGLKIDKEHAYMVNFDCVGRGAKIFVSGDKAQKRTALSTEAAKRLKASATCFYPSDHLSFGKPWKSIAFARTDRFWMLDLGWVHSKADVPEKVRLEYIEEVVELATEYIRTIVESDEGAG